MSRDRKLRESNDLTHLTGRAAGLLLDGNSPTFETELRDCWERVIRAYKVEAIMGRFDRERSTVYGWAAKPGTTPVSALPILAELDPDPELLARLAGCLMAEASARAMRRQAVGESLLIVRRQSAMPWGRGGK